MSLTDFTQQGLESLIVDVRTGKLDVSVVELPEPNASDGIVVSPEGLESVVAEDSPDAEEVPDADL